MLPLSIQLSVLEDSSGYCKTASRTAKLLQVKSLCRGFTCKWTSEWMSTNLCSFALCQLVPFFPFLSKCSLLRNFSLSTTLHALALKFQSTWMVPSNDPFLWKQTSEKFIKQNSNISYISVKSFWISMPIKRKEDSLATPFFCDAYLWSSIWSSTVKFSFIFLDLCRFSRVDVPPSGLENVPKPRLPPYRSPLFCRFEYLQRNNMGQMLWKCAPCPVHCMPE